MTKTYKKSYLTLALALLFLFSFFNIVSAGNPDYWREYSPQYIYVTQSYDNTYNAFSGEYTEISTPITFGTTNANTGGYIIPFQPNSFLLNDRMYEIITNGQNLSVYDNTLTLLNKTSSGSSYYSLSIFSQDNQTIRIFGLFNNGSIYWAEYDYDPVSNELNNIFSTLITGTDPSNIKCINSGISYLSYPGVVCFGFTKVDGTNSYINIFYDNSSILSNQMDPNYPVNDGTSLNELSILDADNDGNLEVLGHNFANIYLSDVYGNVDFAYPRPVGWFFGDAVFFRATSTTYRIAYTLNIDSGDKTLKLGYLTLYGTDYAGSPITINTASAETTLSVYDYNSDNIDEIAIAYSNNTHTFFNLFDTTKTSVLAYNTSGVYVGEGRVTANGNIITADLNNDGYKDIILNKLSNTGYSYLVDLKNKAIILNHTGYMTISDINTDGLTDLYGYNSSSLFVLYSGESNSNAYINSITYIPSSPAIYTNITFTINANDTEDDPLYYYLDCGNGLVLTESQSNTFQCNYNSSGQYTIYGYVRDQYHGAYNSSSTSVNIGLVSQVNGEGTFISALINPFLSLFPDADTLTLGQKLGITLLVMIVTVLVILFAGSQLGADGLSKLLIYIIVALLIMEFVFFVGIRYIPIGIFITIILIAISIIYLAVRGRGG